MAHLNEIKAALIELGFKEDGMFLYRRLTKSSVFLVERERNGIIVTFWCELYNYAPMIPLFEKKKMRRGENPIQANREVKTYIKISLEEIEDMPKDYIKKFLIGMLTDMASKVIKNIFLFTDVSYIVKDSDKTT